jgi:hypothetical protein
MADNGDRIVLNERYEINPANRLTQFDQGQALAYGVEDLTQSGRKLFALVAPGHLPCQGLNLPERRGAIPQLWPEATGIQDWPVSGQGEDAVWGRRPILVYAQPGGQRMAKDDAQPLPRLNEQAILQAIVRPAIAMLREFVGLGVTHRAIRPSNIFYAAGDSGEVIFGECFSMPHGSGQPVAFETIENGMADPMARGPGATADDLYALGVLLLILNLGRNPVQGMSDDALIAAKLNFGSFSALTGGEKVSPTMAELLRGLLSDKVADRWTLRNLEMWANGQHSNPVLPSLPQRATRPMKFAGADHLSRPVLASAMAYHWDDALAMVEMGTLDNWMRRSFGDDKVGEQLALIRNLAAGHGAPNGVKHRTLSRLIHFMANSLPICYRALKVNVTGLGTMLATIIDQPALRTEFVEMLRARLPQNWLDGQTKLTIEMLQMRRVLDAVEKAIERPGPGYSVERVLYELDPGMPCRSALIDDFYVTQLSDLLPAIDAALPGAEPGTVPMDRHIAAFIAARIGRSVEHELGLIANMADQVGYRLGILRLLANVQRMHFNRELPRLAEALAALLDPVVESFHNVKNRADLRARLKRLVEQSDLTLMAELLDQEGPTRRADDLGFAEARQAYAILEKEAVWLESGGMTEPDKITAAARANSAMVSAFLTSAAVAAYTILMAL